MCVDELDWQGLNPYFIGLSILILPDRDDLIGPDSLNPYFIGLSILISSYLCIQNYVEGVSQSLFYWIIYSYNRKTN